MSTVFPPNECPKCGSKNMVGEPFETSDEEVWQPVTCYDCGCEWDEVYLFCRIENIRLEEKI